MSPLSPHPTSPVFQIEPARSSQEKSEARSLTLAFDDSEDLSNWFLSIQRALSFGAKGLLKLLVVFKPLLFGNLHSLLTIQLKFGEVLL